MGVPVISLQGDGMVGRLSASLLHHGGLEHCIASNKEEYVKSAKNFASHGPRWDQQRLRLRDGLEHSELADGARLSSELEKMYGYLRQQISYS